MCILCGLSYILKGMGYPMVMGFVRIFVGRSDYVTADELEEMMHTPEYINQTNPNKLLIIDARRNDEYYTSHIYNATNIHSTFKHGDTPKKELQQKVHDVVDKETTIVFYCAVGLRSAWLAKYLKQKGYKNAKVLYHGYYNWANSGRPIYTKYASFRDPLATEHQHNSHSSCAPIVDVDHEDVHRCSTHCQRGTTVLPQHFIANLALDGQLSTKTKFPGFGFLGHSWKKDRPSWPHGRYSVSQEDADREAMEYPVQPMPAGQAVRPLVPVEADQPVLDQVQPVETVKYTEALSPNGVAALRPSS